MATVWRGFEGEVVFSSSIGDLTRASAPPLASHRQSVFATLLKTPVESLFATLFPGDCRICSEPLLNISRLPVCQACLERIPEFRSAQCAVCGELLLASGFAGEEFPGALCGLCQRFRPTYVRATSCGPYEEVLRDMVHLLKYQRVRSAARMLGERLAGAIRELLPEAGADAIVVPVPLHSGKFHQRGFNQSQAVARHAVRVLKHDFPLLELEPDVLRRKRATGSQTGLTRHQRRQNVRGAFGVTPLLRKFIHARNIILVDDVFTTGTTVEECSRVLVRAGAAKVWVATVARVSKLEGISMLQQKSKEEAMRAAGGNVARA